MMLVNALRQRLPAQSHSVSTLRTTIAHTRFFSTDESGAAKKETEAHTKEEIEKGREEWGVKYDDECLKFEKEWKIIAERVEAE